MMWNSDSSIKLVTETLSTILSTIAFGGDMFQAGGLRYRELLSRLRRVRFMDNFQLHR